jgi:hypothetical protein
MKIRKIVSTIVIAALLFWAPSFIPARASVAGCGVPVAWRSIDTAYADAIIPCPPVVAGLSTGAAITVGFIGFVAALCLYDVWLKINGLKNWDGSPKVVQVHHHH